jgi:hypothetical protein
MEMTCQVKEQFVFKKILSQKTRAFYTILRLCRHLELVSVDEWDDKRMMNWK